MIVKGRARSGGAQLAAYLMRPGENPSILTRGVNDPDLHNIFVMWETVAEGTRGEKGIYHAQIAPEARYHMTTEQWLRAAEILAEELGLKGHDRREVLHADGANPHLHVAFMRTDIDSMTLQDDSFNYRAHERASARMEQEFGHEHVPGKHDKRDREKQPEFPKAEMTTAEAQQADRTAMTAAERKEQVTALRAQSDNAQAFKGALEDAGYILARGDTRGYVIVDRDGEVYSLSRQVTDLKSKDFKAFMDGIDKGGLPDVDTAKAVQEKLKALPVTPAPADPEKRGVEASKFVTPEPEKKPEAPKPAPRDEKLEALEKAITDRQAVEAKKVSEYHDLLLKQKEYELERLNKDKIADFDKLQTAQRTALQERLDAHRTGLQGFLDAMKSRLNPTVAAEEAKARRDQTAQLERRLEQERKDYLKLIEQTKQLELGNMKERQAQENRDRDTRNAEERERYIREYQQAEKLREQLKETKERDRGLDPPRVR